MKAAAPLATTDLAALTTAALSAAAPARRRRRWLPYAPACALALVALAAPLVAGDRPIVARADGVTYWPAIRATCGELPLVSWFVESPATAWNAPWMDEAGQPAGSALFPPIPYSPTAIVAAPLESPSRAHWLGTDDRGRDVAARLVHGAATSLGVGFWGMTLALAIGLPLGAACGYGGRTVDLLLSRVIEVFVCFPAFFLLLALVAWRPASVANVILVVGITRWTGIARYVRAEVLRVKTSRFVEAATVAGSTRLRTLLVHVLPVSLGPALVAAVLGVADAILIEAGLSWLGFGTPDPTPSWGTLLRAGYDHMRSAQVLVYAPCAAILVAVLAAHLLARQLSRGLIGARVGAE